MKEREKRKLSTYHGRLFTDKEQAEHWLDRMRMKLGGDYTYECKWHKGYELWHGVLYREQELR
tara:strand:+ start:336 stop:524 length:189 start_codon:yes stop_codon:yes gene_type:complete